RDALHPVRHRGDLPLPRGGPAAGVRDVRPRRGRGVHRTAHGRVRVRVAERSARMEVVRRGKVSTPDALRGNQRRAQELRRGPDLEGAALEKYVTERVMTTTLDRALNWARANSMFPATFGLACCAIEMMAIVASRVDSARIGSEAFRATPRQADLMIISGR